MNRLRELSEPIESRQARIGVIGLGYVGLPLALATALTLISGYLYFRSYFGGRSGGGANVERQE